MEATGRRTRVHTNIMKLLFSIGLEFKTDLDDGHLSEDLRRKFEVGHGIALSQDITISLGKECSEWLILVTQFVAQAYYDWIVRFKNASNLCPT